MKGISLAIETIVFIILAVTVLTVLLFFFTSTSGQSQHEVQLQQQRQQYCMRYAGMNPTCNEKIHNEKVEPYNSAQSTKSDNKLLNKIAEACVGLGIAPEHCKTGAATFECVKACCIQCP